MNNRPRLLLTISFLFHGAWACADPALDSQFEYGPTPTLVDPNKAVIPRLHMSQAIGWPAKMAPHAARGTSVSALATGLSHPRWLYVLPNGDVLVAESEAPFKPDDARGITGLVGKLAMKRAGSGRKPSANRITLLRDVKGDGIAVERYEFLTGLNSPIGMALVGNTLYVANSDAVVRFPYRTGETQIHAAGIKVTDLPAGTINHHWTKTLIASPDGQKLYVGVGSNSNVGEHGMAAETVRAAVWEIDARTGAHRVFASGLRNPVGLAWQPDSGKLWVAVNERDDLGDQVPPDYMTALREGAFYGFPYSYYGQHVDDRVKPQDPALVATATAPDYALGAHTASLGLCWSAGSTLPEFKHGMFIGQHGSWNRAIRSGYKVIYVPFSKGVPSGPPRAVLTGFLNSKNEAMGRPVGLAIDQHGSLLVADDVGNTIWKVSRGDDGGADTTFRCHCAGVTGGPSGDMSPVAAAE